MERRRDEGGGPRFHAPYWNLMDVTIGIWKGTPTYLVPELHGFKQIPLKLVIG